LIIAGSHYELRFLFICASAFSLLLICYAIEDGAMDERRLLTCLLLPRYEAHYAAPRQRMFTRDAPYFFSSPPRLPPRAIVVTMPTR